MKFNQFVLLFAIAISLPSCGFFGEDEKPLHKSKLSCYIAIDKGDTAWLSIDTSDKKIDGLFKVSYGGIKKYDGQIKGDIKGDTLKTYYDFKVNKFDKWYRNPVAFLRKEGKLIMGVGEIVMVWGSGVFDEKTQIDYNRGRFVFEKVACSN